MTKLLIVSRTPWNNSNSFGNTFSNIFDNWEHTHIYNICCQGGESCNSIVKLSYQMTDKTVLQSIVLRKAGKVIRNNDTYINIGISKRNKYRNIQLLYYVRDLIWLIGKWWNKDLVSFLDFIKPDIIYLPLYASQYMCDVQYRIVKHCNVPVVGHISDDLYSYFPAGWHHPLEHLYRKRVRKKIKELIDETSYVEVFADNMAKEYSDIFKKPFYIIGKGVNIKNVRQPQIAISKDDVIHFLYTGGISEDRLSVLIELGKSIDRQVIKECVLDIYTSTYLTPLMMEKIQRAKSIRLHGSVNSNEIVQIQNQGDYLVHVEGFSQKSIVETRMSFSTKIIDYLMTGNLMLAIGPSVINSIQEISKYEIGLVVCELSKLDATIKDLLSGEINTSHIQNNAYNYLVGMRDKVVIKEQMMSRMHHLILSTN